MDKALKDLSRPLKRFLREDGLRNIGDEAGLEGEVLNYDAHAFRRWLNRINPLITFVSNLTNMA
jgi:hypothetical protein